MSDITPTFGTALRMLDLLLLCQERRYGLPVDDAAAALEVDRRTVKRYVHALQTRLVNADGAPLIEIIHASRRPVIYMHRRVFDLGDLDDHDAT